jgi:Protein of unknown function (DUF2934)
LVKFHTRDKKTNLFSVIADTVYFLNQEADMEAVKLQPKRTKSAKKKLSVIDNKPKSKLNPKERNARVAIAAYYKAQARGFVPGYELEDWLAAEAEENQ